MLPIALGEATKTVPYAVDGEKAYRFTVRWGPRPIPTMPRDASSRPASCGPSRGDIEAVLPQFTGEIMQMPPAFSAIKVDGRARLRPGARRRDRRRWRRGWCTSTALELIDMPDADTAVFEARCGKGTYVRALARDMGVRSAASGI